MCVLRATNPSGMLDIFSVLTGSSVLTLRVDHPFSYVTRIYDVTFLVENHYGTERLWGIYRILSNRMFCLDQNEYLFYESVDIVMPFSTLFY